MKILILIGFFLLCFAPVYSQAVQKDSTQLAKTGTVTQEKDKQGRQVFQGAKGGKFVICRSKKTQAWYKKYLPKTTK